MSMKSPSSVHSATSTARSSTSALDRPAARPPRMMFSRPDRFLLKPTPSASKVLALPQTSTLPDVGGRMPAMALIKVDFPAPLAPMMPMAVPAYTSKLTFRSASTSLTARCPRPNRISACLRVGLRSNVVRYVMDRSSTRTANGGPVSVSVEADSKLTLPGDEEQKADRSDPQGPCGRGQPHVEIWNGALLDQLRVATQHRIHRVDLDDRQDLARQSGNGLGQPQHGREIHPNPDEVGQKVRGVAEVDLQCGEKRRKSHREDDQRAKKVQGEDHAGVPRARQKDQVKDQIDRHCGQEAEERRSDRGQRHQQPRECRVDQQLAGADHRCGSGG